MKKILLLQNTDSGHSKMLGVQLEAEGFCVDHAREDNQAWIQDVESNQPDVILMEVDGNFYRERYHFCHQLRQETQTQNIPVLLLGASQNGASIHYLLEGLHAGANDYLRAPYEITELVGKINTALRLKASLEQAQVLAQQLNEVNEELYHRNIQIEKELYIARQLQQSLLPKAIIKPDETDEMGPMFTQIYYQDEKIRISGIYLPCDALGGDLYDVLTFTDNALGISIADVSGHGVPAGFVTAIFKTSLFRITQFIKRPNEVLYQLNNELYDIVKTGDYVTGVYMRVNLENMMLECSGAGHPYPFLYRAQDQSMHRLKENGTPLVWVNNIAYPQDEVQLGKGDKVFLFTDGISELRNPAGDMFSEERIESILMDSIRNESPYITDDLIGLLSDYTEGTPLEDDISMILLEIL